MDRAQTLHEIAEILELQEQAIKKHPARTGETYRNGRDALIVPSQTTAIAASWAGSPTELSTDEVELLLRYILSSSFISASYHLQGDKSRRDQAAHSCCTLIGSLGPDSELIFHQYLEFEKLWHAAMARDGIAPGRLRRLVGPIIVGLFILLIVRFCV